MELHGDQIFKSKQILIAERSQDFKSLLSFFEGLNTMSKISMSTTSRKSMPFLINKEKPKKVEQNPVLKKKQKRVSFDLTKNTTYVYESEDSIQRRLEVGRPLKDNTKIITETIIMPIHFEMHHESESRMFDYNEIRHFWANLLK